MTDARQTVTLISLAAAMLIAALYGPGHGSPEPAVMLTIMVGSMTAGIAGLAFSAICGAVLLHIMDDPLRVIQLLAVCSFANQILTVWTLRRDIAWRRLGSFVAGGVAGIGPGLWTLVHINPRHIAPGIGAVLLAYAAHLVFGRMPMLRVNSSWADAMIGFTASSTGVISTLPSLPVTVWCQARGLDKDTLRATVQPFVLATQFITLPMMAYFAPDSAIGPADLLCIPASLFGTKIGLACVRSLSNRQFALAVAGLLVLCSLSLCF